MIDAGMIERCVRDLGVERLLFGTDLNHERARRARSSTRRFPSGTAA